MMSFVVVALLFGLFVVGLALAIQGFVGREINPEGQPFVMTFDPDRPGIKHPPERHPVRLFLIGLLLMVLAVVLGIVLS